MRRLKLAFRGALALAIATPSIFAQSHPSDTKIASHTKVPELELRIIPDKETYVLSEAISAKMELVNLTERTMCFPEPSQGGQEVVAIGSLSTQLVRIDTNGKQVEGDRFIDHYDGGPTWPREKLRSEIEQSWVKLAPNQTYTLKSGKSKLSVDSIGRWQFMATYNPPGCSFNVAECMNYLRSAAESVGCSVPEMVVKALPVTITVVAPPEPKQSIK